jgi:hypothetical protein
MNTEEKNASPRAVVMMAACAVLLSPAAHSAERGESPSWWGALGLGYGYLSSELSPTVPNAGGVWLEAQLGARVTPHWFAGFELGGLGAGISQRNYDPYANNFSVYGQSITHALLIVQYAPRGDAGWLVGAGVGGLLYDNHALQRVTSNQRSGNGAAALARIGYEWRTGRHFRTGIDFTYERGNIRLNAPLSGEFGVSMIAAGVHLAYR